MKNRYLEIFLRNHPQANVIKHHWWEVNSGSGNGLVWSGNKPLPEPMLTQICVAINAAVTYLQGPVSSGSEAGIFLRNLFIIMANSLHHQVISNHDIDNIKYTVPCLPCGTISTACAIAISINDRKCKYILFLQNNSILSPCQPRQCQQYCEMPSAAPSFFDVSSSYHSGLRRRLTCLPGTCLTHWSLGSFQTQLSGLYLVYFF